MLARNIHDEDTIELQFSAAELELLTQAAAQAEESAPVSAPAVSSTPEVVRTAAVPASQSAAASLAVVTAPVATSPPIIVVAPATAAPMPLPVRPIATTSPATTAPRAAQREPVGIEIILPAQARGKTEAAAAALRGRERVRTNPAAPEPRGLPFGLRTAAVLAGLVAVLAIALWPRPPTPDGTPTPATPNAAPTAAADDLAPGSAAPAGATSGTPSGRSSRAPSGAPIPGAARPSPQAAPPDQSTVRFVNPFDRTEVFEFPAGTPWVEARDQVAQQLITRARERSSLGLSSTKNTAPRRQQTATGPASFARQL
jgi:hypothetical protein